MAHNDYIERLTEAQLQGRPLPEPTTPEEEVQLQQFHDTDALFEEIHTMRLGNDWMSDVWSRIDSDSVTAGKPVAAIGEPTDARATAQDTTSKPAAERLDADDDEEPASTTGGTVIDASSRFRIWPMISGVAVAAMALLVVGVFMTQGRDDESSGSYAAAEAPAAAEREEMANASGDSAQDLRTMAQAEMPAGGDEVLELEDGEGGAPPADATGRSAETTTIARNQNGDFDKFGDDTATIEQPAAMPGSAVGAVDLNNDDADEEALAMDGVGMGGGGFASADPSEPRSSSRSSRADKEKKSGGWGKGERDRGSDWGGTGDDLAATATGSTTRSGGWRPSPPPERVRLTAGEVDDNTNFDDFKQFLAQRSKTHLEPMDVSERMFVRVLDQNGRPIPNATVDFRLGEQTVFSTTSYSDGWVLFHPRTVPQAAQAEGFDLSIRAGQAEHSYRIQRGAKEEWQVRLPVDRTVPARQKLDLVFLLDTTQSMQDQIDTLQQTIRDVVSEVNALPGSPEVRLGLVVFRDDTDEYVSKVFDFQTDVGAFQRLLGEQTAAGGGDLPERVEVGLHRTVHELSWGQDSTRMVFLVGDAGPHKRSLNEFSYAQDAQAAASKGIKLFSVATSGLDDDGEYVFRQLAQYTMGRFIFLTTGAGGTSTVHDVKPGSFQPETLDRLVVRLVRQELSAMELAPGELREMQGQSGE